MAGPLQEENLRVSLGMRPDFGGPLELSPGESFALPAVAFTATGGNLDDGANQLHRYQRRYVVPRTKTNDPLLVQFNSWYPFPGKMQVDDMKRCADVAARLGAEVFVLDAGLVQQQELGAANWVTGRTTRRNFPTASRNLPSMSGSKGMKFGIWVEIENLGVDSAMFRSAPRLVPHLQRQPVDGRRTAIISILPNPRSRQWARSVIDRLVKDYGIEWLKIDYNIDIGERFDPPQLGRAPRARALRSSDELLPLAG